MLPSIVNPSSRTSQLRRPYRSPPGLDTHHGISSDAVGWLLWCFPDVGGIWHTRFRCRVANVAVSERSLTVSEGTTLSHPRRQPETSARYRVEDDAIGLSAGPGLPVLTSTVERVMVTGVV